MNYVNTALGLVLLTGFLACSCGTLKAEEKPNPSEAVTQLLERLGALQHDIAGLQNAGHINQRKAKSLSKKLDKVTKALSQLNDPHPGDSDDDDDDGVRRRGSDGDDDDDAGVRSSGTNGKGSGGGVSIQQLGSFLRALQTAIDAMLDFVSELTRLVTDLPSEVVQPLIDAAIDLLREIIGLLLSLGGG